ncbi:MAG: hypothetical protein HBSIN02_20160 [Bacteroidia bacterium]|nr:MAG: hypothetical protein HBSIN02_20160 [Bacteroidia bacterium]
MLIRLIILLPSLLSAQSYYNFRDGFLDRKGEIETMELSFVDETPTTRTFDFRLTSSSDDSLHGRIRMPKGTGPFPAALLCVGLETGREVIEMIEGQDSVMLMAADYPFEGEWNFQGWAAVGTTFRLRSAGFRTVPLLLNCLDWLFELDAVDKSDVTVVAVSFGAFTGVPAAVLDPRVKQLVIVQSGGNLSGVIAHNSKRWGVALPSWLAGWLGGGILAAFEPTKYIRHLTPRRLIMINGEGDSFFTRESAEVLYEAADEPKEIIWHKSRHVMPGEKNLIRELTNMVVGRIYQVKWKM